MCAPIDMQVVSLCAHSSKSLTVDLAVLIQGEEFSELPERILGCVRLDQLDLEAAESLV